MNYTNREVVRRLKQYDMFLNSLNLTEDQEQKERICDQLDKIEKQILLETNTAYEEEYMFLLGQETNLFAEEKTKLRNIINLIVSRRTYLEERKLKHKNITGSLVELTTFLGEDKLTVFRKKLKIIEKYEENKIRQESLIKDMKKIDVKISEASRNVKANTRLNDILENKMMGTVGKALDKLDLYKLVDRREDVLKKYESLKYVLELAKENLKTAKELNNQEKILECDNLLSEITIEYSKYNEELNIINLIDIYDKPVSGYEELLNKREKINNILENITESNLYSEISEELNKQYNTIKLQRQDINTYETLKEERDKKNKLLYEIEEENNSKEFKLVLDELIRNENRYLEEKIRAAKKQEYQERQKKLIEEQKIEESRVRRQKLIEKARLKEQQERALKVKELQEKTVINPQKEESLEEINNPLKNKTFDEVMSLNNSFNTNELFENTKIIPNKKEQEKEESIIGKITNEKNEEKEKQPKEEKIEVPVWDEPVKEEKIEVPVWNEPVKEEMPTIDLFKEEKSEEIIEIKEKTEDIDKEEKQEETNEEKKESIYDILENNKNIIWKPTKTEAKVNPIPVIGNNNLKPEILENGSLPDMTFPEFKGKEGEILWKENL